MRLSFARTLTDLAAKNPRVVLLTGDLGFELFDDFQKRFGPRYINAGVAEAQMICAAAGLALEGWRPFTYSIASFHLGRPYEQIRVSVGYPQLPVVIVGVGGGYGYAHSGITHHSVNDFALMGSIPGMSVVAPGDTNELERLLPQIAQMPGPCYLRISRSEEKKLPVKSPPVLGQGRLLKEGERIAILSTGDMACVVMQATDQLEAEKISPLVYQMHTVRPFDIRVLDDLPKDIATILVVEEHVPDGGLTSAVCAWRSSREKGPKVVRLGPPNELALGNPHPHDLRHRLGYDAESIAQECRILWKLNDRATAVGVSASTRGY